MCAFCASYETNPGNTARRGYDMRDKILSSLQMRSGLRCRARFEVFPPLFGLFCFCLGGARCVSGRRSQVLGIFRRRTAGLPSDRPRYDEQGAQSKVELNNPPYSRRTQHSETWYVSCHNSVPFFPWLRGERLLFGVRDDKWLTGPLVVAERPFFRLVLFSRLLLFRCEMGPSLPASFSTDRAESP